MEQPPDLSPVPKKSCMITVMFAITHKEVIPLVVVDAEGTEQNSARVKLVIEDTESSEAEVDKIYVELNDD